MAVSFLEQYSPNFIQACIFYSQTNNVLKLSFISNGTVVLKRKSKWHDLWSKWPIYDLVFYNIKMPSCSCPLGSSLLLTGALNWGTVQTSTSTGTRIMKGQT